MPTVNEITSDQMPWAMVRITDPFPFARGPDFLPALASELVEEDVDA